MSVFSQLERVLPRASFARSAGTLVGGTAGAQLLILVAAPILTRLYTPDDFGVLAVYVGLLSFSVVIANLRYPLAVPLVKTERNALALVALCIVLVTASAMLLMAFVWTYGSWLTDQFGVSSLKPYLWVLPVGVLAVGIFQPFNYLALRKKRFSLIAKTRIVQTAAMLIVQTFGGPFGVVSLLVGHIIGQALGFSVLARSTTRIIDLISVGSRRMWQVARSNWRYPAFSSLSAMLNTAGVALPPLLLAAFFSPSIAGIYALSHRVLEGPLSLVSSAVANVFFSQAAEEKRSGTLAGLFTSIHRNLSVIALPPLLIVAIIGPESFEFVFGDEWRQAGEFARWLAIWTYMVFCCSPLSTLFFVLEKQAREFAFQFVLLSVRIGAIVVGAALGSAIQTIALFSVASAVCWALFLLWMNGSLGNSVKSVLAIQFEAFARGVLIAAPLLLAKASGESSWMIVVALVASMALLAFQYIHILAKAYPERSDEMA